MIFYLFKDYKIKLGIVLELGIFESLILIMIKSVYLKFKSTNTMKLLYNGQFEL